MSHDQPAYGLWSMDLGRLWSTPTLLTQLMFPILLLMYGRLAVTEEAEIRAQFGEAFESYTQRTPRFFPYFKKRPI